jgi:hypothetical protein
VKIYYDTEFIDDGKTIDLVSIGMVAEDGRELYVVSKEFPVDKLQQNKWLKDNVWYSLPRRKSGNGVMCECTKAYTGHSSTYHQECLDVDDPTCRPRKQIARMVSDFIQQTPKPELWVWYAAYDHVALAQLFGSMIHLPKHIPMFTMDLKQEHVRLGEPTLPKQLGSQHNALEDARYNQQIDKVLASFNCGCERKVT